VAGALQEDQAGVADLAGQGLTVRRWEQGILSAVQDQRR
jgi:hypothetical protein